MVEAWSIWFEKRVVIWDARVSRLSMEAVAGDLLRIAAYSLVDVLRCVGLIFYNVLLCEGYLK
jgi:hypothetical protein